MKQKNRQHLKFIDLFAGIGGFRIAGERSGMKCVFSSEINKSARKVYRANFGKYPSGDITKINANSIPDFNVLFGGFPCQPFSYAGKRKGFADKTRGTLFFDIVRILKAKHPEMFLLENVKGLKSHHHGRTLKIILNRLKDLNYYIHWTILNSLDYGGVPQSRCRWYCVGFLKNYSFSFPGKLPRKRLRDILSPKADADAKLRLTNLEIKQIDYHFKVCPASSKHQLRVKHDSSIYNQNSKKGRYGVYSYLRPNGNLRFYTGDPAKSGIQGACYCNSNGYSPTITATHAPKMWDLKRTLSDRECARLQGFPESFKLSASSVQNRKQMGNAVTVPVVSRIVHNMLKSYRSGKLESD